MLHLPDGHRNNLIAAVGEFVGTFLFLFFGFSGAQIANTPLPTPGSSPNHSALLYVSLAFGFSLTVNVWAFYRVTGGLFNPAVSSFKTRLLLETETHCATRLLWPYV
jgi:aquaporin related protein